MNLRKFRLSTAIRIAVLLLCAAPGSGGVPYTSLANPMWWGLCAIASLVFLATASSGPRRIGFGLAMAACLAVAAWQATYFFPLQQRVEGATFVDAPLPDVLRTLSQQRRSRPYRRFVICDKETLDARLTITLPDGAALGESLQRIADATGCSYHWIWWSSCGFTYPPTTTRISFYSDGKGPTRGLWELDRNRLWLRDEYGVLLSDPNGVSASSVNFRREVE